MSACPAVICPAVSACVRMVFKMPCCAVMVLPWMLSALMLVVAMGLPPSVTPASISPALTATSAVESAPSVPTVTS